MEKKYIEFFNAAIGKFIEVFTTIFIQPHSKIYKTNNFLIKLNLCKIYISTAFTIKYLRHSYLIILQSIEITLLLFLKYFNTINKML